MSQDDRPEAERAKKRRQGSRSAISPASREGEGGADIGNIVERDLDAGGELPMDERRGNGGPSAEPADLLAEGYGGRPSEDRGGTAVAAHAGAHRAPDPTARGKRKLEGMRADDDTAHLRNVQARGGDELAHPAPTAATSAACGNHRGARAVHEAHLTSPCGGMGAGAPRDVDEPGAAAVATARRRITGKSRATVASEAGGAKPQGTAMDPALDGLLRGQLKTVKYNVDRSYGNILAADSAATSFDAARDGAGGMLSRPRPR